MDNQIIVTNLLDTQDGEGLSYYCEPEGVYRSDAEGEDELERARR